MKNKLFVSISLMLFCIFCHADDKQNLSKTIQLYSSLTKDFKVKSISAFKLKKELSEGTKIVLIDAREPKEYKVSKLPGAITKSEFEKNPQKYFNTKIVVYCTVGYRSAKFCSGLKNKNVFNLEGGVLAWSHFGGEFTHDGKTTSKVHTYSKEWNFLNSKYEAVYE